MVNEALTTPIGGETMLKTVQTTLRRAHPTLVQDFAGLAALVVMLLVGLHLPVLA